MDGERRSGGPARTQQSREVQRFCCSMRPEVANAIPAIPAVEGRLRCLLAAKRPPFLGTRPPPASAPCPPVPHTPLPRLLPARPPHPPAHHRHAAVAQRDHLSEAARLKHGRHQHDVGGGVDEVRQRLAVHDLQPARGTHPCMHTHGVWIEHTAALGDDDSCMHARMHAHEALKARVRQLHLLEAFPARGGCGPQCGQIDGGHAAHVANGARCMDEWRAMHRDEATAVQRSAVQCAAQARPSPGLSLTARPGGP